MVGIILNMTVVALITFSALAITVTFLNMKTPCKAPASPEFWPQPVIAWYAHPCVFSSALSLQPGELGELAIIMAHCPHKADTHLLFVKPQGMTEDWVKTDLWQSAIAIPDVKTNIDEQGQEANIFHARISGQVMLYDCAKGRLHGGITSSRGHWGDNDGQESIEANRGKVTFKHTAFFGCSLLKCSRKGACCVWKH